MSRRPSVGRVVHYVSYGTPGGEYTSECRAAIVTESVDGSLTVGLCVLNPTGMFFNRTVRFADHLAGHLVEYGGTWHWPERTD